jgi:hypothetical protein
MRLRSILIALAAFTGVIVMAWNLIPARSRLEIRSAETHFPIVSGFNLERREFEFPRDFAGELNVLFVPFLQRQQLDVNTWVPFVQELERTLPGVVYYELPTIWEMAALQRMFLNEGMRAGIPDAKARERTVTLYLDKPAFQRATGIDGDSRMHVLLVNRRGDILWRTTGSYSDEKGNQLLAAIDAVVWADNQSN